MKKIIYYLFVILSLFVCSCNDDSNKVLAQDNIWENVDRLKVDIDNVIDFTADGKYFYFLTDKEIIKVDGYGKKISSEKHENVTGICYDPETKGMHRLYKNRIIVTSKGDSIMIDSLTVRTEDNITALSSTPITYFLAYDGELFYTAIFLTGVPENSSVHEDDYLISVNPNGKGNALYYYKFWAGIFCKEDYLLALTRNRHFNSNDYVRIQCNITKFTDKKTYKSEFTYVSPYLKIIMNPTAPAGLYVDKNNFYYTYSQYNKTLIKFKEDWEWKQGD
jgi:hypothetical protein